MPFRRSITARAKLYYQHQRVAAPFPHIHRDDNDQQNPSRSSTVYKNPLISDHFQRRLFGTGSNLGASHRSGNLLQDRRFAIPAACGPVFMRNMSSLGEGPPENIEVVTDMTNVLSDKAAEVEAQVAHVANEVAIAAADFFRPVASIQHLIDHVHCSTGFNWWASIVLTTILIRCLQLPITIYTRKSAENYRLLKLRLEEFEKDMRNRGMSPADVAERRKELWMDISIHMRVLIITGPAFCCFLLAVSDMAKNVPSFKEGGAFWFTDLSTPDSMFIFPILTALSYWIRLENHQSPWEGLKGKPTAGTSKHVRVFAALTIPLGAMLTKATLCYLITNNLFGLAVSLVLKNHGVKKFLGFPIIPVTPPSPDQK